MPSNLGSRQGNVASGCKQGGQRCEHFVSAEVEFGNPTFRFCRPPCSHISALVISELNTDFVFSGCAQGLSSADVHLCFAVVFSGCI
jgi:hypothetical protein